VQLCLERNGFDRLRTSDDVDAVAVRGGGPSHTQGRDEELESPEAETDGPFPGEGSRGEEIGEL
jgi:hypothetical protein